MTHETATTNASDQRKPIDPSASVPRKFRACIFGASLDVENRGVLALAVSLAGLLIRAHPGTAIAFHYSHQSGGTKRLAVSGRGNDMAVEVLNCRMSPKSAPAEHILIILGLALLYRIGVRAPARRNAWLRSLLDADFIGEITGGDSFSDIYGFRLFVLGTMPLMSAALLGCSYVMLPQTYGPFRRRTSRWLAGVLLRRATTILTRDRNCEALVLQISGRLPLFCPDVAFTLEPRTPEDPGLTPSGLDLVGDELVVGINVSGLLYMGGYTGGNMFGLRSDYRHLIDGLVARILSSTRAKVLLVPHVFGAEQESAQEEEACSMILQSAGSQHPGQVYAVTRPLSERELKWVIGRTHFFIGSRMHACIGALSQCVPALGLAYSDKFLGVFESAGVGDATIDLRKVDTSEVIDRAMSALGSRHELREILRVHIPAIQEQVMRTLSGVLHDQSNPVQP